MSTPAVVRNRKTKSRATGARGFQLWDSMADTDIALSAAQQAELEDRLVSFDEERSRGVTWDELKAELAARALTAEVIFLPAARAKF
jgi:putative addiction module component (TIGR02574 family)